MSDKGIISLSFNQDFSCFVCCTEKGVRIYNTCPMSEKEVYSFGGVAHCEMLFRTNLFSIVGGGRYPKYSRNTCYIYDAIKDNFVMEANCDSAIKSIQMRRSKMTIVTLNYINLFSFPGSISHQISFETRPNPLGLCDLSPLETSEKQIIVYPGHKVGSVYIKDITNLQSASSSPPAIINAHQGELSYLALNMQGTLLATASNKGTLIRVWDTIRKTKVAEFRRGSDPAKLYCINFSPNSEFLCCSSDKGTVHIFALKDSDLNRKSSLSTLGFFSTYVESQWAFAHFTVPPEVPCICAFTSTNNIVAICMDGTYHNYSFFRDGTCRRRAYSIFLNNCEDDEI